MLKKIEIADSLKFTTPKGKIVYGGGGIIPDVFVPIDAGMQNETIAYLQRRGYFSNFVFEALDEDRAIYKNMSRQDFIENFEVTDDVVIDFQEFVKLKTRSKITFVAYYTEIKQYLKGILAEQLYGNGAYQEVVNKKDLMIEEVIKLSTEY